MIKTMSLFNDEAKEEIKKLRSSKEVRWLIFEHESDRKTLKVSKSGDRKSTWKRFKTKLPSNAPRFAMYDFEYKDNERQTGKLYCLQWLPENSAATERVVYASLNKAFKSSNEMAGALCVLLEDKDEVEELLEKEDRDERRM